MSYEAPQANRPEQSAAVPIRGYGPPAEAAQDPEAHSARAPARMTDEQWYYLLENWSRWDRVRRGIETCNSIEKKWKSPQEWGAPGAPPPIRSEIDVPRAIAVNRAWLFMPQPYKSVLRDWYVLRRHPRATCRAHAIKPDVYEEYVRLASLMCRNIFLKNNLTAEYQ